MEYCPYETAFEISPVSEKKRKEEKKKKNKTKNSPPVIVEEETYSGYNASDIFGNLNESFTDAVIVKEKSNINPIPPALNKLPSHFLQNDEGFTNEQDPSSSSSSSSLPLPSIVDNWKPLSPSKVETSFYETLPAPGGTYPIWNVNQNDIMKRESNHIEKNDTMPLIKRIEELEKRLQSFENEYRRSKEENKKEILLFVGTGLAMILALNVLSK